MDTEIHAGISALAGSGLELFVGTDEAKEGALAFVEKRSPNFDTVSEQGDAEPRPE